MQLHERLEALRSEEGKLHWEGTFGEYFDMVTEDPRLARLSHARIYDMIVSAGVETDDFGNNRYNFFEDEIYGIEKPLDQIVEYFRSSAQRLEVRKRIMLLDRKSVV